MAATSPRELQRYLVQKLEENADRIAPELREFVGGNSPGEIDVSIARVVEKTDSILESAGVRRPQPAEQARWDTDRLEGFGERAPDLNVADMDMATWAQHRKQLLRSNSDGGGIWGPGGRD